MALEHNRINGFALAAGADALGALGRDETARAWTRRALLIDPDNLLVRMNVAGCLATYFSDDDALDVLEPAVAAMGPGLFVLTKESRRFDRFLDHPRFKSMMAEAEARLGAKEAS